MRLLVALAAAPVVLGGIAVPAVAEEPVQDPSPSTNEANKQAGWAYFDATAATDSVLLVFQSSRTSTSCFEYRSERSAPIPDATHDNELVTDGVFESVCVSGEPIQVTVEAEEYVEVRLMFGTEPDERFDWTRVDVAEEGPDGQAPEVAPTRPGSVMDCKKGGWKALDYKNQGRCVSEVRKHDKELRKQARAEQRAAVEAAKATAKATKKSHKLASKAAKKAGKGPKS
jgi:hypothetical protein